MNFARWETKENMIKLVPLTKIDEKGDVKTSGMPVAYDEKNLYIDSRYNHSLVIGTTGSGKTQAITLPMLDLACLAGESVIVHDTTSELYELTNEKFADNGYHVIKLNFDDAIKSNHWNPFELPFKLYKEGNMDKAQDLVEDLGFYLLNDINEKDSDPFWINSAIDYFTGLTFYAFDKKENVNINTIFELDNEIREDSVKFIKEIDKKSNIYINLRGVLEAPKETKGSILSVFNQKIKRYISKEQLKSVLSKTDFDISKIGHEKTIIYVVTGNSNNSERLLPLLISQVYYAKDKYSAKEGKISIIIDDFNRLYPIKDFAKMLNYSRHIGIMFTIMIRGFNDLNNIYGKEQSEILKLCFVNIIYLLSQDISTLNEISDLCGGFSIVDGNKVPLIAVEELKTLDIFEAIIITTRIMPFKTKLLPYYLMKK